MRLGEMRESGPRRLLVHCADYKCTHHVEIDADGWPDEARRIIKEYIDDLRELAESCAAS